MIDWLTLTDIRPPASNDQLDISYPLVTFMNKQIKLYTSSYYSSVSEFFGQNMSGRVVFTESICFIFIPSMWRKMDEQHNYRFGPITYLI